MGGSLRTPVQKSNRGHGGHGDSIRIRMGNLERDGLEHKVLLCVSACPFVFMSVCVCQSVWRVISARIICSSLQQTPLLHYYLFS